jgi:tripeptide aminopeptidase
MSGDCDSAKMHYIIRDHDRSKLEALKNSFLEAQKILQKEFPAAEIKVSLVDDYRNMKEVLDKDPRALNHITKVFESLNIPLISNPIRGGTDGAGFSFKGCPTPNLGTGSYNHHGRFEYLSVQEFNQMIEIVKRCVSADIE